MLKNSLIAIGILAVLLIGYYAVGLSTGSVSSPDVANFYKGKVTSVDSDLRFKLDCCDQELQLGLVKNIDQSQENISRIESIMKKYELSCTSFDMGGSKVELDTVYCSNGDRLISGLLISEGFVRENCDNSGNQFGTCS